MPVRRLLLWLALAMIGLLVAVGVTTAATNLTSQRVGLSAEPLDAGDQLAPKPARSADPSPTAKPRKQKPVRTRTPQPTPEPTPSAAPSAAPVDDNGGGIEPGDDSGGHGSNSGHGGDDD
jgi:hypothetical protein